MKLRAIYVAIEGKPHFEIPVAEVLTRHSKHDYRLKGSPYSYFQYDSERHDVYVREHRTKIWLDGYLIRRNKKGVKQFPFVDCKIQLRY